MVGRQPESDAAALVGLPQRDGGKAGYLTTSLAKLVVLARDNSQAAGQRVQGHLMALRQGWLGWIASDG